MVHLSCERRKRYLRFLQANRGEEIVSAEVIGVDASPLNGTGTSVLPSRFDIEVLHQSDTGKEVLSGS
jgi:hypothetical protein